MLRLGVLLGVFFFLAVPAHALVELGYSASYRKSHISEEAYDESLHHTGSLAYYFFGSSAVELSATVGTSERVVPSGAVKIKQIYDVSIFGLDFVFNFGSRETTFAPYLKLGAAYFAQKKISTYYIDNATGNVVEASAPHTETSVVPSGGIGLRWNFSERFSFKAGIDVWTSQALDQKPVQLDMAARAGLSWFL